MVQESLPLSTLGASVNTLLLYLYSGLRTNERRRNEPDFATPYLYNYINKQAKSVQMSRNLGYQ